MKLELYGILNKLSEYFNERFPRFLPFGLISCFEIRGYAKTGVIGEEQERTLYFHSKNKQICSCKLSYYKQNTSESTTSKTPKNNSPASL